MLRSGVLFVVVAAVAACSRMSSCSRMDDACRAQIDVLVRASDQKGAEKYSYAQIASLVTKADGAHPAKSSVAAHIKCMQSKKRKKAKKQAPANKIPRAQRHAIARTAMRLKAKGQGIVTGAEFEVKNGSTWYEVTTQKGSNEVDHRIDPMTGEILASTSGAQEKDGDSGTEEAQEFSAIQGAKFSLLKAISEAEAQGNKVLGAEFEHEDDKLAIELRVADAAGVVSERMIAADTGSAIPGDQDDRENDDGESAEDHEG